MATTENKVQFNLKNMHYAVMTAGGNTPTWDTPVPVPGAVSLALEQKGELNKFYADGIVYYQSSNNGGYEGDAEFARIIDKMLQDIWGYILSTTEKVLIEDAFAEPKSFALLFQIDGDQHNALYCLYNCTATRPGINSKTNEESKEPQPQKIKIFAASLENGRVFARTTAETTENTITKWFTKVFEPAPAA